MKHPHFPSGDDEAFRFMPTGLYLNLYHGRDSIDDVLSDWGFNGPCLGPLDYVHVTYMCDVKFGCSPEVFEKMFPNVMTEWREMKFSNALDPHWNFTLVEDLIEFDGKYYGDWSVFYHVQEEANEPA